jgi:putative ABC transport system permease protein
MLGSYFRIALRNLTRHKTETLINVLGLAVGIASCILIMIWFQFELSYDKFHHNIDDLYLLGSRMQHGADREISRQSPPMAATATRERCPAVVNSTRFNPYGEHILQFAEKMFAEQLNRTDAGFFKMFSFSFLEGNPETAFADKYSIVLTKSIAEKYFGEAPALGKIIRMDYVHDMQVTGVVEDVPKMSTLRFKALIPFEFVAAMPGNENYLNTWFNLSFSTYIQLQPGTDWREFNKVVNEQAEPDNEDEKLSLYVFPFRDLNLKSVSGSGGFIATLILYCVLAGIILLIACINFMNLATARASSRAKEVGVRKVIGASRRELMFQFFIESLLQAGLALVLALVLVEQFLPFFRNMIPWAELQMDYFGNPGLLIGAVVITGITGLVAGSYPALVLSSFKPIDVLHGTLRAGSQGALFRRILVVVQFAIAVVLVICTMVIYQQFDFLCNKSLGHSYDNIVMIKMNDQLKPHFDAFKADLENQDNVRAVTKANRPLSGIYTNGHGWTWPGRDPQLDPFVTYLGVGLDYRDVYEIEMAEGIFFDESHLSRDGQDVVVNQAFADLLGDGPIVNKKLYRQSQGGLESDGYNIIGVVKDFHYKPVSAPIQPLLIEFNNQRSNNYAFIKIADTNISTTLESIEASYHRFLPDQLFEYAFAADDYDAMYGAMTRRGEIMRMFSCLAVLFPCMGLFGLASHLTEKRAKEIGIRKVLGASISSIVFLLTKDFVRWVGIANLIAWPTAFVLSRLMLQSFRENVGVDWLIFAKVGLLTVLLAIGTVSFRSIQAAVANPVDAIRQE